MKQLTGIVGTMLWLVALYLALRHAGGFTKIIREGAKGGANIFRTLQGR